MIIAHLARGGTASFIVTSGLTNTSSVLLVPEESINGPAINLFLASDVNQGTLFITAIARNPCVACCYIEFHALTRYLTSKII